jgi:hypothetical protein
MAGNRQLRVLRTIVVVNIRRPIDRWRIFRLTVYRARLAPETGPNSRIKWRKSRARGSRRGLYRAALCRRVWDAHRFINPSASHNHLSSAVSRLTHSSDSIGGHSPCRHANHDADSRLQWLILGVLGLPRRIHTHYHRIIGGTGPLTELNCL